MRLNKLELIKSKAMQNLSGKGLNIWDVLIEDPENSSEIITIAEWVGKKCITTLATYFTSGYANSMLKECDKNVVAKSLGAQSFETIKHGF